MSLLRSGALLRVTIGLMLAQSLAQAAHSTAVTVNTLAAVQLSGGGVHRAVGRRLYRGAAAVVGGELQIAGAGA